MESVTPEPILKTALGFMAAKQLFAASEIGLFAALAAAPLGLDALAERTGVPRHAARIVADAMVSLGLLEKDDDRYRNGVVAAAFLAGGEESGLRPTLRQFDRISYRLWLDFETIVRAGRGRPHWGEWSAEEQSIASAGIAALTMPVAAALAIFSSPSSAAIPGYPASFTNCRTPPPSHGRRWPVGRKPRVLQSPKETSSRIRCPRARTRCLSPTSSISLRRNRTATCCTACAARSPRAHGCCSSISGPIPLIPDRRQSRSWPASFCCGPGRATSTAPKKPGAGCARPGGGRSPTNRLPARRA